MALSGTIEKQFHGSGSGYYFGLEWRVNSQSVASNSSNVTATVYIRTQGNGYTINSSAQKTVSVTINGTKYLGNCTVGIGTNSRKNLFSKTVDVPHNGDGNKTCDFACALDIEVSLGGRWYGKITHSGQGTFNKINLNTAPWWTSDDTHMTAYSQALKANTIIPENANEVVITSSTAWDNEQGGNLHFDIHRYVNGSHSAQIKWGGSSRDVTDYLANWGAGTVFKYEAKVHDGQGLWAPGSRWSWVYTKNRFSPATVGNIGSIGANQNALNFTAFTARNQGGLCNNNYHYRITSLTPGVNIYGTREHSENAQRDVHFTLGVKNNGGAVPTNPHWLDANEIKNYLASNGYNGNIRLRIESWNDYGSSGNADFNVWVDLRKDVPYTTIRHNSGWITHKGTNYYMPAHLPIDINWDAVSDPLGGTITYEVLYQIGDGGWIFLSDVGTATKYKANLAAAIGNSAASNFRFIVRAKTSYGKKSESGGPRINLSSYSSPTIRITEVTRNKTDAVVKGFVQVNSSISGGTPTSAVYKLNNGGNVSFLNTINSSNGSFTFTVSSLDSSKAYSLNLLASDSIRDALKAKGITLAEGSASTNISVYIPAFSIRRNGVGVNAIPDGSAEFMVNGLTKTKQLTIDGFPATNTAGEHANKWTKVATLNVRNQYGDAVTNLKFLGTANGRGLCAFGELIVRLKQQQPMGQPPEGIIRLFNNLTATADDFKLIITSNTNSITTAELWYRNTCSYETVYFYPIKTVREVIYHENEPYQNNLPSGRQFAAVSQNLTADSLASFGDVFGKIPQIGGDGVMEVGKYIDFHLRNDNKDYDARLWIDDNCNLRFDNEIRASVIRGGSLALIGNDFKMNEKRALVGWAGANDPLILNFSRDFHGGIQAQSEFQVVYDMNYNNSKSPNNTSQIAITSGNNGMGIGLSSDFNSRNGWIQVGHNDSAYANVFGSLRLNPKGGTVWIHNDLAMSAKTNGEYYGLCVDGNDSTWIRTSSDGIIPHRPGIASNVGTGSWCFNEGNFRYICSPNGQNIDINGRAGVIYFNVNSASGCALIMDRSWGGTAGSEACLRANKTDGWGFLGGDRNKFYRVYASGGSVGSYKPNKYDVTKYDTESLYNYVKDMNVYLYRTKSILNHTAEEYAEDLIKNNAFYNNEGKLLTEAFKINNLKFKELDSSLSQEDILKIRKEEIIAQFNLVQKEIKREDLMLGTMIHELPTEVVDYDTEGHEGKTVELYSYTTMAIGAIKHLQGIVDKLQNRITELEAKNNGDSNQKQS